MKRLKRRPRNIGIVRHAKQLGVSVVHLGLVIKGARRSEQLLERYKKLLAEEDRLASLSGEFALVETTLAQAAELRAGADEGGSGVDQDIAAKMETLITPEAIAAVSKLGSRLTMSTISNFAAILPTHLFDRLFGIKRNPKNFHHVVIA